MKDYDSYSFSLREFIMYVLLGIGISGLISYVFYRSVISFIIILPITVLVVKSKKAECVRKQKSKLMLEFKEMMSSVTAGLEAGYSIENAFINSYHDMIMMYGREALITRELSYISKALKNNRNIEELLEDLGKRSHIQDIEDFAEIFKIAKRSGGNLPEIIHQTADIIGDKMDVNRRIETIISSKQFEQNIMNVVPFAIILYIDMTSPGFFSALYNNFLGIVIMTVLLIIYLVAYYLAAKITNISI